MDHQRKLRLTLLIIRWSARTVGLALLLLAGAFFLEHLEWLSHPGELPPVSVLAAMFFHFALLAGLVLGWRWELLGGLVVIAAVTGFFLCLGRDPDLLEVCLCGGAAGAAVHPERMAGPAAAEGGLAVLTQKMEPNRRR